MRTRPAPAAAPSPAASPYPGGPAPLRVLLLEDNEWDAEVAREALALMPAPPVLERTTLLAETLQRLAAQTYDVVLLDLNVPDSRGLDTVHAVRAAFPQVALVAFTGEGDFAMGRQAVAAGAQDFIQKGEVGLQALGAALEKACGRQLRVQASDADRAALSGREQRYRLMVENASDGIMETSEGKVLFANPAALRMFGYPSLPQMQGEVPHSSALFARPAERDGALAQVKANPSALLQLECRRRDGTTFWAQVKANALPLDGGATHIFSVLRDMTAERAVREVANHLAAIIEGSHEAIFTKDLDGIVRSWNPGAQALYGYTPQEAIGSHVTELIFPPEGKGEENALLARIATGQAVTRFEARRRHKDGRPLVVSVALGPVRDASGRVVAASVTAHDVSAQHEQKDRAEHLARDLEEAQALAHVGSYVYDFARDEMTGSPEMYRIYGVGPNPTGRRFADFIALVHPDDHNTVQQAFGDALERRSDFVLEHRIVVAGVTKWVAQSGRATYDEAGKPLRMVGTSQDVTEAHATADRMRALNEELERRVGERTAQLARTVEELDAFTYSVSHDLRAPLRSMDGFTRILLEEHGPTLAPEARHLADNILGSAEELGQLVTDLLEFSRASRAEPVREPLDLTAEATALAKAMQAQAVGRTVQVDLRPTPGCEGDPRLMRQVLTNLLSNAFKFTGKTPSSRIAFGYDEAERAYFLRDNGTGFDMQYTDKLFTAFQRLHSKAEFEGTGIGLAIVRRIVERHGGRVWAKAEVGKGATFWFTIPAAPVPPPTEVATA